MQKLPDDNCAVVIDPPMPRVNPRFETPGVDPNLGANRRPECSITESLAGVADDLRQLYTEFGQRPYRLFSVVTCWDGGEKGRGRQQVVRETELLPTPLVSFSNTVGTSSLRGEATPGGRAERGMVRIKEVSPRYTEDDIYALFFVQPLPPGHEAFIEMRMDARDGNARRRRFVVSGVPERRPDKFDWIVNVTEQEQPRSRLGALPGGR